MKLPRRILVVDDDEVAIQVIRGHLMSYDFEVEDLRVPTKVMEHLHETNDYGLFIFDVHMPNKDGITLATQIRNTFKSTTPILFVSSEIDDQTSNRIRRLSLSGIVGFLKKGEFDSKQLFDTCQAMMKEHYQLRKTDELTGRLGHVQSALDDGMNQITNFIERFEKKQVVTVEHCDEKAQALVKAVRSDVIGIVLGKTKGHIDKVLEEDVNPKIEAVAKAASEPPSPDAVAGAVEKSLAFKVLKWALITIATLYGSWLGYTHFLAAETKDELGTLKGEVGGIKTGQGYMQQMMKQQSANLDKMQSLIRSMHGSRRRTRMTTR